MNLINIGVIGYGYWGPKLVRNFTLLPDCKVRAVADPDPSRLAEASMHNSSVLTTTNADVLITDPTIDALAIATPVSTHFELASKAIREGKHVWIEKPMAASVTEAERLIEEAAKRNLVLLVDHTFVYTGAVRKIKELVDAKELGRLYYYDSIRINLGLFQHDINVLWDLAVHDLGIIDHLFSLQPVAVTATGISHLPGEPENVAYLTCFFEDNMIAHVNVNWLAPAKLRLVVLGGDKKMIVYDDNEADQKIKVYDKGVMKPTQPDEIYKMLINYRVGDMWAPKLEQGEALRREAVHFLECVGSGKQPVTGGEAGLRVVRVLEAAGRSLRQRGIPVDLETCRL